MKLRAFAFTALQAIFLQLIGSPATAQTAPYGGHVTYLDQGWSADTTRWWHFLSQGTAFMPYEWFVALEQPVGTERFGSPGNMARLGFLIEPPDQTHNPAGLPVGFAKVKLDFDQGRFKCWKGDWVGFACAACHTGQVSYQGHQIRIEGGAARHDVEVFGDELRAALAAIADPAKQSRFVQRVAATGATTATDLAASLSCYSTEVRKEQTFLQAAKQNSQEKSTSGGFGRLDAHERGVNLFLAAPLNEPKNFVVETAPVSFPALWDTPYFDWVLYNAAVRQPLARNIIEALGVQAPIDHKTIVQDKVIHSLQMDNIVSGQRALRDLKSPAWPEAILGVIDVAKATRGKELYDQLCANCHQVIDRITHAPRDKAPGARGDIVIPTFDLGRIGTDPRQAETFARRKVTLEKIGGEPAEIASHDAAQLVTGKIATQWIDESPTNAARAQAINVGRPNDFRALLAYRARPLNGIWATAPYLHNGSVPSLYELLLPANQRSKMFFMGNWEFNPEVVGVESNRPFTGDFPFDTALPGNSNAGHEFGTDLNDSDRRALIEYLKTL